MERIQEILNSSSKHKAKVTLIVTISKNDPKMVREIIHLLESGTDLDRGTSAEILKRISKSNPKLVEKYIDTLIQYIDYKVPQVKREIRATIGNLAEEYPDVAAKAISKLLDNTEDENNEIRRSTAYALTEIAKNNPSTRKKLIPIFDELIEKEINSGIRTIYIRTLKDLNK